MTTCLFRKTTSYSCYIHPTAGSLVQESLSTIDANIILQVPLTMVLNFEVDHAVRQIVGIK